jgi:hypothetical protein
MNPLYLVSIVNTIQWVDTPIPNVRQRDRDEPEGERLAFGKLPKAIPGGYETLTDAIEVANELAAKNPGSFVYVFSPTHVFEAIKPTVIPKHFNERGELIVNE